MCVCVRVWWCIAEWYRQIILHCSCNTFFVLLGIFDIIAWNLGIYFPNMCGSTQRERQFIKIYPFNGHHLITVIAISQNVSFVPKHRSWTQDIMLKKLTSIERPCYLKVFSYDLNLFLLSFLNWVLKRGLPFLFGSLVFETPIQFTKKHTRTNIQK